MTKCPIEHDRVVDLDYRDVESIARAVKDYPDHMPARITRSPTMLSSHKRGVETLLPWLTDLLKTDSETITLVRKMTSMVWLSVVCFEIPDDHPWQNRIMQAGRMLVARLSHDQTRPKRKAADTLTAVDKREIIKEAEKDDD